MKTKENVEVKPLTFSKPLKEKKSKSLRPMRSMVALRSLKPRTAVATMNLQKPEELSQSH